MQEIPKPKEPTEIFDVDKDDPEKLKKKPDPKRALRKAQTAIKMGGTDKNGKMIDPQTHASQEPDFIDKRLQATEVKDDDEIEEKTKKKPAKKKEPCPFCNKLYSPNYMNRHIDREHPPEDEGAPDKPVASPAEQALNILAEEDPETLRALLTSMNKGSEAGEEEEEEVEVEEVQETVKKSSSESRFDDSSEAYSVKLEVKNQPWAVKEVCNLCWIFNSDQDTYSILIGKKGDSFDTLWETLEIASKQGAENLRMTFTFKNNQGFILDNVLTVCSPSSHPHSGYVGFIVMGTDVSDKQKPKNAGSTVGTSENTDPPAQGKTRIL